MAIEGGDLSDYDPVLRSKLQGEAARIIRAFGFAGAHVIIIGGLVPSLLVPEVEVGFEPHVGTTDLDLCLSVALVEGDVGAYDKLEKCLRDAGFEMAREEDGKSISWRWIGGKGTPVTVEFFCSMAEGRVPGRLHRPGGVVGGRLSALVLATGALIDRDFRMVELEVELPEGAGRTSKSSELRAPALTWQPRPTRSEGATRTRTPTTSCGFRNVGLGGNIMVFPVERLTLSSDWNCSRVRVES